MPRNLIYPTRFRRFAVGLDVNVSPGDRDPGRPARRGPCIAQASRIFLAMPRQQVDDLAGRGYPGISGV
jgi:hypothetical protein